jgi:hypothetical protein
MTLPDPKQFAASVRRQAQIIKLRDDANSLLTDAINAPPEENPRKQKQKTGGSPQTLVGEFTDATGKRHPLTVVRFPQARMTLVLLGPKRK